MDKHRQIAFILAFIVAMVIMMIGKSCTDSDLKKKNPTPMVTTEKSQGVPNGSYNNYNNYNNNSNNNYNNAVGGNVQTEPPVETQPSVIYVTNMLGDVVGTETTATQPIVTDENGVQYTETVQETTDDGRSILDRYNEERQNGNPFKSADSESPTKSNGGYQVPSEIKITIN